MRTTRCPDNSNWCATLDIMAAAIRISQLLIVNPLQSLRAAYTCTVVGSRDLHSFIYSKKQILPHVTNTVTSRHLHNTQSCEVVREDGDDEEERERSRRSLYFPRRGVMYVPSCDERKVKKTTSISVDSIVFDLEDGVAPNKKDVARKAVGGAIATSRHGNSTTRLSEHVVRVNSIDSGLVNLDLREVFKSCDSHKVSPDAVMLPKVETVEHVAELDLCLSYHRPSLPPLPLYVMTESPQGLLNLPLICHFTRRHANHLSLCAVVFGSDDYLAAIGGVRTDEGSELEHVRQMIVGVARGYGVAAIDMVTTDFKDEESLKMKSEEAARMGFTGKQVIHPAQVEIVQEAFTPSLDRLQWATGLIAAFTQHQTHGQGAFVYQDQMIDKPLLLQAQNIVSIHGNISRTNNMNRN